MKPDAYQHSRGNSIYNKFTVIAAALCVFSVSLLWILPIHSTWLWAYIAVPLLTFAAASIPHIFQIQKSHLRFPIASMWPNRSYATAQDLREILMLGVIVVAGGVVVLSVNYAYRSCFLHDIEFKGIVVRTYLSTNHQYRGIAVQTADKEEFEIEGIADNTWRHIKIGDHVDKSRGTNMISVNGSQMLLSKWCVIEGKQKLPVP